MENRPKPFILHPENRDFLHRYPFKLVQRGAFSICDMFGAATLFLGWIFIFGGTTGPDAVACFLIDRNGALAPARIEKLERRPNHSAGLTQKELTPETTAYFVTYRFDAPDSGSYTKTESTTAEEFQRLSSGGTFNVRYWRGNPAVSRRGGSFALDWVVLAISAFAACVWLSIPAYIFVKARRDFRRRREILGDGDLLRGTVESATVEAQPDGTSVVELAYKFKLLDGTPRQGTDRATLPDTPGTTLGPGTQVFVIVAPDRVASRLI